MNPARIREARLEAGLSLAQLAGNEVSRTFIHFIEHGRSRPSRSVLALIARRTGKPISYFLLKAMPEDEDLVAELLSVAGRIGRAASVELNKLDRETLKQIELTTRQSADLIRMMQLRDNRL